MLLASYKSTRPGPQGIAFTEETQAVRVGTLLKQLGTVVKQLLLSVFIRRQSDDQAKNTQKYH